MAEWLTINGTPVPVLEDSWEETILLPGSQAYTETGHLRSVRTGEPVSQFVGASLLPTRAEADALITLLKTYGDLEIAGEGPGRTVFCETKTVGPAKAVPHRPRGADPTAMWRLSWTLIETGPVSGGS